MIACLNNYYIYYINAFTIIIFIISWIISKKTNTPFLKLNSNIDKLSNKFKPYFTESKGYGMLITYYIILIVVYL